MRSLLADRSLEKNNPFRPRRVDLQAVERAKRRRDNAWLNFEAAGDAWEDGDGKKGEDLIVHLLSSTEKYGEAAVMAACKAVARTIGPTPMMPQSVQFHPVLLEEEPEITRLGIFNLDWRRFERDAWIRSRHCSYPLIGRWWYQWLLVPKLKADIRELAVGKENATQPP